MFPYKEYAVVVLLENITKTYNNYQRYVQKVITLYWQLVNEIMVAGGWYERQRPKGRFEVWGWESCERLGWSHCRTVQNFPREAIAWLQ